MFPLLNLSKQMPVMFPRSKRSLLFPSLVECNKRSSNWLNLLKIPHDIKCARSFLKSKKSNNVEIFRIKLNAKT